jgi:hypothetical protein
MAYYLLSEDTTYNLVLNSTNKISGSNNNATYQVNFQDFLPQNFDKFKVVFSAQTAGGYYKDVGSNVYSSCKVYINFNSRSYSYDTSTKGQSTLMGILQRDVQTSTSIGNTLSAFYAQYPPRTIIRPITNQITVTFLNTQSSGAFVNTDSSGNALTDMTDYTIFLEFIPIGTSSKRETSTI